MLCSDGDNRATGASNTSRWDSTGATDGSFAGGQVLAAEVVQQQEAARQVCVDTIDGVLAEVPPSANGPSDLSFG